MEKVDMKSLAGQMIEAVRGFVAKSEATINARLDEFDVRLKAIPPPEKGDPGEPGLPGEPGEKGDTGSSGEPGEPGKDGESIDPETVAAMVAADVADAVAALPPAKDGDPGPKGDPGETGNQGDPGVSVQGEKGDAGADGKDGQSIHPDTVALMVTEQVAKAISALPAAKDGTPGRDAVELNVLPGIDETRSYSAGTYAKYGGGEIRATRKTEPVTDGDIEAAGWTVAREGIAAVVITQGDDPRAIEVACMLTGGTKAIAAFTLPTPMYMGVWREGEHKQGDMATWSGSTWHCNKLTEDKPGTSDAWTLMVKAGRPGKDGDRPVPDSQVVRLK